MTRTCGTLHTLDIYAHYPTSLTNRHNCLNVKPLSLDPLTPDDVPDNDYRVWPRLRHLALPEDAILGRGDSSIFNIDWNGDYGAATTERTTSVLFACLPACVQNLSITGATLSICSELRRFFRTLEKTLNNRFTELASINLVDLTLEYDLDRIHENHELADLLERSSIMLFITMNYKLNGRMKIPWTRLMEDYYPSIYDGRDEYRPTLGFFAAGEAQEWRDVQDMIKALMKKYEYPSVVERKFSWQDEEDIKNGDMSEDMQALIPVNPPLVQCDSCQDKGHTAEDCASAIT